MTRDLVDQMGDHGRLPRDLDDDSNVTKSSLHDLTMALHYDTGSAVLVSETGEEAKAVWLPKSQVEITDTGRKSDAIRKDGEIVKVALLEITIPEWLAKKKGLI